MSGGEQLFLGGLVAMMVVFGVLLAWASKRAGSDFESGK